MRKNLTIAVRSTWVPERQDIIWIDCNPQVDSEMRDIHPMLVLSPRTFNNKTGLVIGLPMTTAAYNATNPLCRRSRACHRPHSGQAGLRPLSPAQILRLAIAPREASPAQADE